MNIFSLVECYTQTDETGATVEYGMQVSSAPFPSSGVVRLNVGGDNFVTTVETLASKSGFFQSLSCEGNAELSKTTTVDDGFFFDRDGPSFAIILGYLRTNCIRISESLASEELVS